MLNIDQLVKLEDVLLEEFNDNLTSILSRLNRTGKLEVFLELLNLENLLVNERYIPYKTGKIIIAGASDVKENVLLGIAKSLGISKDRFEFCLDYDLASKYNYKKTQYNPNYSLVLFGPVPHSGHVKGTYSSIISALENTEGYPNIKRLGTNTLKITKSSFKESLLEALNSGIICQNLC